MMTSRVWRKSLLVALRDILEDFLERGDRESEAVKTLDLQKLSQA